MKTYNLIQCKRCNRLIDQRAFSGFLWWRKCNACIHPHIAILVDARTVNPTELVEREAWLIKIAWAHDFLTHFSILYGNQLSWNMARTHVRDVWTDKTGLDRVDDKTQLEAEWNRKIDYYKETKNEFNFHI